jgi:hypothetical protein
MSRCSNVEENRERCSCTYAGCPRKGMCCECLQYHLARQELPGCCFPPEIEQTYDRSLRRFVRLHGG